MMRFFTAHVRNGRLISAPGPAIAGRRAGGFSTKVPMQGLCKPRGRITSRAFMSRS